MKRMKMSLVLLMLFNLSCEDILEVVDISEEQVAIVAPSNNVILNDSIITFTWQAVMEADRYHLQVVKPSFVNSEQVVIDSLLNSTKLTSELGFGTYEWRIRAENSGYKTEYITQKFSIEE